MLLPGDPCSDHLIHEVFASVLAPPVQQIRGLIPAPPAFECHEAAEQQQRKRTRFAYGMGAAMLDEQG
jgi:hypothetical protein